MKKHKTPVHAKIHAVAGLTLIASHYIKMVELAEVVIFFNDIFHHARKVFGGLV